MKNEETNEDKNENMARCARSLGIAHWIVQVISVQYGTGNGMVDVDEFVSSFGLRPVGGGQEGLLNGSHVASDREEDAGHDATVVSGGSGRPTDDTLLETSVYSRPSPGETSTGEGGGRTRELTRLESEPPEGTDVRGRLFPGKASEDSGPDKTELNRTGGESGTVDALQTPTAARGRDESPRGKGGTGHTRGVEGSGEGRHYGDEAKIALEKENAR